MKIGEAERHIRQELADIYDEGEATNIAILLLSDITLFTSTELIIKKEDVLKEEHVQKLDEYLSRLKRHEPVQYILGKAHFYGLDLYVNNAVLIPRPETEELVEWVLKDMEATGTGVFHKGPMEADHTTQLKILDVGTGSGCIALALKHKTPAAEVWGCDISEEALNIARRNGSELNIRVDFQGLNFLDPAQQKLLPTVDILVSNPPYVPLNNKEDMQPNVVQHEPHTALFVPDNDVLVFYKALATFGKHRLYKNGCIYMEIHEDLGSAVKVLFEKEGYVDVVVKKDMQGKERMVKAVLG